MGNYPDERSSREEIGRYIAHYNTQRPHQALFNFAPAYVHRMNKKTALLNELKAIKKTTRKKGKEYGLRLEKNDSLNPLILSH